MLVGVASPERWARCRRARRRRSGRREHGGRRLRRRGRRRDGGWRLGAGGRARRRHGTGRGLTGVARAGRDGQQRSHGERDQGPWIPHLIGPAGMADCSRCHSGTPSRGWIPAFGDLCTTVVPAQAGIQGGGERDGFPSSRERREDASPSHQPSTVKAEGVTKRSPLGGMTEVGDLRVLTADLRSWRRRRRARAPPARATSPAGGRTAARGRPA